MKLMQPSLCAARLVLLSLAALLGCAGEDPRPVVVVSVSGVAADIKTLRAVAALNGVKAAAKEEFAARAGTVQFGLRLPEGSRGQYALDVDALQGDGCATARGAASTNITGTGRFDLAVALTPLAARVCGDVVQQRLTVTLTGDGSGAVVSEPAGIDCGATCSAEFPAGKEITLRPKAGPTSRFSGWGGACQGEDECKLTLAAAATATATFTKKVCGPAGFCWENPLPQGYNSFRVWGSGKGDVWAVGDGGLIFHYDGTSWTPSQSGTTDSLFDVWGSSAGDVWAVGNLGQVLHWDGKTWKPVSLGAPQVRLFSVWGSAAGDVWGVGYDYNAGTSAIYRSNGSTWTRQAVTYNGVALYGVSGSGPSDIWAVGNISGAVLRWDGSKWSVVNTNVKNPNNTLLYGVWAGAPNEAWAVGSDSTSGFYNPITLRWTGAAWQTVEAITGGGTAEKSFNLNSVWGSAANDVWTVGSDGLVAHFDGVKWTELAVDTRTAFYGVWGSGRDDVFVVGYGPILRWDGKAFTQGANRGATNWLVGLWGAKDGSTWVSGNGGTVLRSNGIRWAAAPSTGTRTFAPGLWGSGPGDVWLGGDFGLLMHFDGARWSTEDAKAGGKYLWGLWGSGRDDVWAAGGSGLISHFNGTAWAPVTSNTAQNLRGVWGSGKDDVWAVGDAGTVAHWTGLAWSATANVIGTTASLYAVSGSARDDVWAVGSDGTILNYNGTNWRKVDSRTTFDLYGVWAAARNDAWAVGEFGTILHWDGSAFSKVESGTSFQLWGVSGRSANDVYVTGYGGTILHYLK